MLEGNDVWRDRGRCDGKMVSGRSKPASFNDHDKSGHTSKVVHLLAAPSPRAIELLTPRSRTEIAAVTVNVC
jgi:hypothetical protein